MRRYCSCADGVGPTGRSITLLCSTSRTSRRHKFSLRAAISAAEARVRVPSGRSPHSASVVSWRAVSPICSTTTASRMGSLPVVLAAAEAPAFEALVLDVNGAAPFHVDLVEQTIRGPDVTIFPFQVDAADRAALIDGLDEVGLTLKYADDITAWEARTRGAQPWLQCFVDQSPLPPSSCRSPLRRRPVNPSV